MTRSVLIGKGRRITLEELQSVALYGGLPEIHVVGTPNDSNAYGDESIVDSAKETATAQCSSNLSDTMNLESLYQEISEILIREEGTSLHASDHGSIRWLTPSTSIATLTLLALSMAQGRTVSSTNRLIESLVDSLVQLIRSIVTAGISSKDPSKQSPIDVKVSQEFRLPSDPFQFCHVLLKLLAPFPSNHEIEKYYALMKDSILSEIQRIIPLTLSSLCAIRLKTVCKIIDALAALSAERLQVDPSLHFADTVFDIHRPHRGMITSATVLRGVLHGSKFACKNSNTNSSSSSNDDNTSSDYSYCKNSSDEISDHFKFMKASVESIPQYHGPSSEAISSSCRVLELECNCFPSTGITCNSYNVENTVVSLTATILANATRILLEGSRSRMGRENTDDHVLSQLIDPIVKISTIQSFLVLDESVDQLILSLQDECRMNASFIQHEIHLASDAARKKAEEKANRAASRDSNMLTGKEENSADEFAGMTEAQVAKILKKRAEKEAKAATKKAAKQVIGGDGSLSNISLFGTGSMSVLSVLKKANYAVNIDVVLEIEAIVQKLLSGGIQRKPKIPKGTKDYLPEQMMIRDEAFQIIRRVFKSHGAVEIDTPVFELKETLTGKYGEDSKLIYDLADQGGELLALRYDLTVPFARFLALNSVGNIKRFHIGKVYRRDQPALSKGRYREFYQCDFDIAGCYGRMVPDSECLCVAAEILSNLPIGDFGIKLNHRRLLDAILDLCGVPSERFRSICSAVDKLDKEPWVEVKREMVEDKGLKPDIADKIGCYVLKKGEPWDMYHSLMEDNLFKSNSGALEAMEDLRILFAYLEAMDKLKFISFDLSLARGLDYYTGVIYEAVCMNGNNQVGSIGGGGRYDNLVAMFQESGKVTPCVGVSVGIERVFALMEERLRTQLGGSIKRPNVNVLVAQAGENMMIQRIKISKILWDANISAEFNQQENPKLKYEISDALDRGIPFMVIIGEEEAQANTCKVKDLLARTEDTVKQSDLIMTLRQKGVIPVGCEFAAKLMASEKW